MDWLQENSTTLLLMVAALAFVMRGPVLANLVGVQQLGVHELAKRLAAPTPPLLLDVRSPAEFATGHAPHALLIPLPELRKRLEELRQHSAAPSIAVICRSGNRSLHGGIILKRAGFQEVFNVRGGMASWQTQGFPVVT